MKNKLIQNLLIVVGAFTSTSPAVANLGGQMTDAEQDTLEKQNFEYLNDDESLFESLQEGSEGGIDENAEVLVYPEIEEASAKRSGRRRRAAPSCSCAGIAKSGKASWYGVTGNRSANGEKYTGKSMTLAHRCLRFNTRVTVCRTDTGKCASFRVTDRGPFVKGRIVDVSSAGANVLRMKGKGVAHVKITSCK